MVCYRGMTPGLYGILSEGLQSFMCEFPTITGPSIDPKIVGSYRKGARNEDPKFLETATYFLQ